ncbi:MAG: Crp/Fnr family transcriptional regulator [Bacteroidota bacterium]|jgi:CRP-like cAMP-binding protein
MFDVFHKHIEKRISLTEEEFNLCCQFFTSRKVRKNQFLLQQGEVCKHLAFVNDGCLREYSVDHKGEVHIIQFAISDWWIADLTSFLSGSPSTQYIDALQDSEVLLLEHKSREKVVESVPKMERFFRLLLESNYVATVKRINDSLSESAEERYLSFLQMYPSLVEQVPQHDIASYLGITPQSLSRIRKEISQKR